LIENMLLDTYDIMGQQAGIKERCAQGADHLAQGIFLDIGRLP